jgi:hypothetical protein
MAHKNVFYAQSAGVSAVINASACGVLQTARQHSDEIGKIYAGPSGIIGAPTEGDCRAHTPVHATLAGDAERGIHLVIDVTWRG